MSVLLARLSATLAGLELLFLLLILGLSFSAHTVSANLTALYFLGEVICVLVAIPLAIISLKLAEKSNAGRSALFASLGVAAICGFFMLFPA